MDVKRENAANMAFGIYLQCWCRGFIVYQRGGHVLVSGGDDAYARIAIAVTRKFEDILLPRVPRLPK